MRVYCVLQYRFTTVNLLLPVPLHEDTEVLQGLDHKF